MPAQLICTSHSPLINVEGQVDEAIADRLETHFSALARTVEELSPAFIVQFGNDHNSGFALKLMPPFLVALRAFGIGDFGSSSGSILVEEQVGRELVRHLHSAGVDVATSYDARLDHGFVVALDRLLGGIDEVPVVPIFTNCGGDLRPPLSRSLALGTAVGRFLREHHPHERILIIGSGGLSHDPPLPDYKTSPPDMQQRMIAGTEWTPETLAERTRRVAAMGIEHAANGAGLQPLNPEWDRWIMERLAAGDLTEVAALDDADVIAKGGRGASEIRNWLAAFAALQAYGGTYDASDVYYEAVPGWIVGFAMMQAAPAGQMEAA